MMFSKQIVSSNIQSVIVKAVDIDNEFKKGQEFDNE